MGKRTENTFAFLTEHIVEKLGNTGIFLVNSALSAVSGIRKGADRVELAKKFDTPKPQATRNKK